MYFIFFILENWVIVCVGILREGFLKSVKMEDDLLVWMLIVIIDVWLIVLIMIFYEINKVLRIFVILLCFKFFF